VPYEPSSAEAIAAMIELGAAGPSDVVYDLGCGDGRVVIEAVKRSGARGVCVDLDPKLIRQARQNAARAGVAERLTFRTEDLFLTEIGDASVVMLFIWPEINLRLLPKLQKELRPGTRVVSNMHDMGALQPTRIIPISSSRHQPHHVYLWLISERK
jgi:ribosomal protein L11 methylase PrmA